MSTNAEHALIVQAIPLPKDISALSPNDISQILGGSLSELAGTIDTAVKTFDGGGWQVISHDMLVVGEALVVTFLVRRLRVSDGDRESLSA